jgi:hypothetical protein
MLAQLTAVVRRLMCCETLGQGGPFDAPIAGARNESGRHDVFALMDETIQVAVSAQDC